MENKLNLIADNLSKTPEKVFLIDGLGGLLAAFLLSVILARFEEYFGMPSCIDYVLALIACFYAVYSFTCYFFIKSNVKAYLKFIAIANLLYCCLTLILVFYFSDSLTTLGFTYFILEILVIIVLVFIEYKTYKRF
jgi:hypothetical protein